MPETEKQIEQALTQICEHRPGLASTLEKFGDYDLGKYSAKALRKSEKDGRKTVDNRLIEALASQAKVLVPSCGDNVADTLQKTVQELRVVNTGPHHGIFAHPFFTGDLILTTLSRLDLPDESMVYLSDSSIPVNNLTYPRGIVLTETRYDKNSGGRQVPIKIPLSPSDKVTATVSALPFGKKELQDAVSKAGMYRGQGIKPYKATILQKLLTEIGQMEEVMNADSLSDQVVVINNFLFQRMISPDLRNRVPVVATLDCDRTLSLLLRDFLASDNPLFSALIFDPQTRQRFLAATANLPIINSTDLFTHNTPQGPRTGLRVNEPDNTLRTRIDDNNPKEGKPIPLEKAAILDQLESKSLYIGPALIFALLAHYQVDCVGGLNQAIGYLPKFYDVYVQKLREFGFTKEAEKVETADPLRISTTLTCIFSEREGRLLGAGALDVLSKRNADNTRGLTFQDLEQMKALTFNQMIRLNIPTLYALTVPNDLKEAALSGLTIQDIAQRLGLEDKLVIIRE